MSSTLSISLTTGGLQKLKHEYKLLKQRYIRLNEKIVQPASIGNDMSRQSVGHLLRLERKILKDHLSRIERYLNNVKDIDVNNLELHAELGRRVEYEVDGTRHIVTLVDPLDADPFKGQVSTQSPVGEALLHKKVGDHTVISVPRGRKDAHITKIFAEA